MELTRSIRANWLRRHALQVRLTILMVLILLLSVWTLAWYLQSTVREDYRRTLGEQQYSLVSLLAAEVDRELFSAVTVLQRATSRFSPDILSDPATLQRTLESLPVFQGEFEGGTYVTDANGRVLAEVPQEVGRRGLDYSDRDYVRNVIATGKPVIGRPTIGKRLQLPALGIGVPLRDSSGKLNGVLVGVINLETASFLRSIQESRYARAGNYLLVSGRSRQIVAATERFRVMEQLPAEGVNPIVDRFIGGFEGTAEFVNPIGVEVLTAVKQIPTAGWYAAVATPTVEAYAPIRELQAQIVIATVVLTLLMGSLMWWSLSRLLRPLEDAADKLSNIRADAGAPALLPTEGDDEIGRVVQGFNALLRELGQRQDQLFESSELYETVFRTSPDALTLTRIRDGQYLAVNDAFTRIFGWSRDEAIGKTSADIGIWYNWTDRVSLIQKTREFGECDSHEAEFLTKDGRVVNASVTARTIQFRGDLCMIAVTHDLSARKAALDQVHQLSSTDPLTGLANRRLFIDRLTQAQLLCQQTSTIGALIYVDVDDFRTINDALGHESGDKLLVEVADRLRDSVRPGDLVSRLGGDDFVLLLPQLGTNVQVASDEAVRHATHVLDALREKMTIDGVSHERTASVGVALFGERAENPAEPLRRVELAMYRAKAEGRNRVCLFDPAMQTQVNARMTLDGQLREALRLNQFVLHYQPQVDERGEVVGVEGLVRWQHPERGLVSPGEFISFMEESGLIIPLGDWVLETACRQIAEWASDPALSKLTVSVNVSAIQFNQPDFVERAFAALERTGARPQSLKLELTESLLVTRMEWIVGRMTALKERGVRFSLDDFGTGFSSLYYLKRLPFDQLKIDQGFVSNILHDANDRAIARMIVALGESLGLRVIAEGVETMAQRDALHDLGCNLYQGYCFGRPMPVSEFVESLRARAAVTG